MLLATKIAITGICGRPNFQTHPRPGWLICGSRMLPSSTQTIPLHTDYCSLLSGFLVKNRLTVGLLWCFFQVETFQSPISDQNHCPIFGSCLTWFDLGSPIFWTRELQVNLFMRLQTVINHLIGGIRAGSLADCLETIHLWPAHLSSGAVPVLGTAHWDWDPGYCRLMLRSHKNKMKEVPKRDICSWNWNPAKCQKNRMPRRKHSTGNQRTAPIMES